jgi:hypothetical protein
MALVWFGLCMLIGEGAGAVVEVGFVVGKNAKAGLA